MPRRINLEAASAATASTIASSSAASQETQHRDHCADRCPLHSFVHASVPRSEPAPRPTARKLSHGAFVAVHDRRRTQPYDPGARVRRPQKTELLGPNFAATRGLCEVRRLLTGGA